MPRSASTYRAARRNAARGLVWRDSPFHYYAGHNLRAHKMRPPINYVRLNAKTNRMRYLGPERV